jgi:O-antigen/teichoic acid export membrane protein
VGSRFIRVWAGPAAVPPTGVLVWMAAWAVVNASGSAVACMLNASRKLTGQMLYGVAAATANVGLSIVLARAFGITGVIAATVIAYVGLVTAPSALECAMVIRRVRAGWKKDTT